MSSRPSSKKVGLHGLLRTLATAALVSGAAGCADDFIEATCDGELNTVVKGSVRGLEVDIESLEVVGSLDKDRFYLAFEVPAAARVSMTSGGIVPTWLLDFGFNPLGGTASSATLSDNMAKWYGQTGGPKPFWITSRDSGVPCDPLRGSLCGGFGTDIDSSGELERERSDNDERYHRFIEGEEFVGAGTVNFEVLTPEEWKATFSVTIDADELEPTIPGGKLEGCFHTLLVPRGKTREFASP